MINKFQLGGKQDAIMQFVQGLALTLQADPQLVILIAQLNPEALQIAVLTYQLTLDMGQAAQAFQQALQLKTQAMKHGAKLQYLRSLKNKCADDEELYYYKKGGSVGCGCKKKEDGGKAELKDSPVAKFKAIRKGRTGYKDDNDKNLKKLDPRTTRTLPGGKYPPNWSSQDRQIWEREHGDNDEGAAAVSGIEHKEEPLPVKVKKQTKSSNNKSKPIVPKAKTTLMDKCGSKMKKKENGGIIEKFKIAFKNGGSLNGIPFMLKGKVVGSGRKYGRTEGNEGPILGKRVIYETSPDEFGRIDYHLRIVTPKKGDTFENDTTYQRGFYNPVNGNNKINWTSSDGKTFNRLENLYQRKKMRK